MRPLAAGRLLLLLSAGQYFQRQEGSGALGARVQAAVGLHRRRGCIVFAARGSVAAENGQPIKRMAL